MKDVYSFAKHLGAVVRDIIPGYCRTWAQGPEVGPGMTRLRPPIGGNVRRKEYLEDREANLSPKIVILMIMVDIHRLDK